MISKIRCRQILFAVFLFAISAAAVLRADSLPATGVRFSTTDKKLQSLYDTAETLAASNVVQFCPTMKILVEGGGYKNCWLETQPMGGEMYADRDVSVALNNQMIFLLTQRGDGRFAGMISTKKRDEIAVSASETNIAKAWFPDLKVSGHYGWFQGFCFPEPAWRMYFWVGKDKTYLQKLYVGLAAHDAYLWRTRDSNGDGVLETWCIWDTGEDRSTRYETRHAPDAWGGDQPPRNPKSLLPFDSMDVMAYSYDARAMLAKIARELSNGKETFWQQQAEVVRQKLIEKLWDASRHACFDRDKNGKQLPELVHNNLRAMYHGIFTQAMADEFIKYHLLNTNEFWTPLPLPSIAVNEPLFRNNPGNDWSGQPEGLTYQRAIRALENYGHYSLVTELGQKLIAAIERGGTRFTQQFDPFTGLPGGGKKTGYGPTILAALEYLNRMHGIHLDVVTGCVWWSACDDTEFSYQQRWGEREWRLTCDKGNMTAQLKGKKLFECSAGVRVVTDLDGRVLALVGITSASRSATLKLADRTVESTVPPDQVISVEN